MKPIIAYIKEKINTRKMNINYNRGEDYGIESMKFNFTSSPVKEPYGDVSFTTGYDNDSRYTSTFLMSAQEAIDLGKMLIDTAYESMTMNRIIQDAEACEAKLSFLVLKGLITSIRIKRNNEKLENYEPPFYKYTITAYNNNEKVLIYSVVYNLSYFTSEKEINYWKDKLTDKERVQLYFEGWNPYAELEERKFDAEQKAIKSLKNLRPTPIKK